MNIECIYFSIHVGVALALIGPSVASVMLTCCLVLGRSRELCA